MHATHRNGSGNGYRSNSAGMGGGVAAASRISPEGSMRGHRMHHSDYRRNYNSGRYERGDHSRQFQPPPSPPRETDIFMEAGRLAAEYLVSKGMLPPDSLPRRWANGGMRPDEGNDLHATRDSHMSGRSRALASPVNVRQGRRRYPDEYDSRNSRSSSRERRRNESFRNYGSEGNRGYGRSMSWPHRNSASSPGVEGDGDSSAGNQADKLPNKLADGRTQKLSPGYLTKENEGYVHGEAGLEKGSVVDDADTKGISYGNEKDLLLDQSMEPGKESDDDNLPSQAAGEAKEKRTNFSWEVQNREAIASEGDNAIASDDRPHLVTHDTIPNASTKNDSLSIRASEVTPGSSTKAKSCNEAESSKASGTNVMTMPISDNSSHKTLLCPSNESKCLEPDFLEAPSTAGELSSAYLRPGQCSRSRSFPDVSAIKHQELEKGQEVLGRSNSIFMVRSEKRAMDDDIDDSRGTKRPKECVFSVESQSDGHLPFSNSMENLRSIEEPRASCSEHLNFSPDKNSSIISPFPMDNAGSYEYIEEKPRIPGPVKTFDLNLMGSFDINEDHDAALQMFPSFSGTGKQEPINFDLSVGSNSNAHDRDGKRGIDDKNIEVIDLENDSEHEGNFFTHAKMRFDTVPIGMGGFPNNVHNNNSNNASAVPDVQGGYGFLVSENGNPNSISFSPDLNSLQSDIGLPNGEGILGYDDSIYMSLGEIPTSFLSNWEQPAQDFGKPF